MFVENEDTMLLPSSPLTMQEKLEQQSMGSCDLESVFYERNVLIRIAQSQQNAIAKLENQVNSLQRKLQGDESQQHMQTALRILDNDKRTCCGVALVRKENGQLVNSTSNEDTKWMVKRLQATLREKDREICELYMQLSTHKKLLHQVTHRHVLPLQYLPKACQSGRKESDKGIRHLFRFKIDEVFYNLFVGKRRRAQQLRDAQVIDIMQREIDRLKMQLLSIDGSSAQARHLIDKRLISDSLVPRSDRRTDTSMVVRNTTETERDSLEILDRCSKMQALQELLDGNDLSDAMSFNDETRHHTEQKSKTSKFCERLLVRKRSLPTNKSTSSDIDFNTMSMDSKENLLEKRSGASVTRSSAMITAPNSMELSTSARMPEFDSDNWRAMDHVNHDAHVASRFHSLVSLRVQQYERNKAMDSEAHFDDNSSSDRASCSSFGSESFIDLTVP
uniref:AlNc14C3G434 protein n=1 Tax=Albugo laibachii Nc14 TaxID=890382 RepID=F0VZV6_9STRA|nr:AlNc14C3G434 [Albugo laibachii Nc14]|eukprot:CCA14327.1 AlNc14C3G434 [Albugo laibachii Nc14]